MYHRYDIIEAELKYRAKHIQSKKRPYIIVSNERCNINSDIITIMPLTHIIKRKDMPVHGCLKVDTDNGLKVFSMILGEQIHTIMKEEVIRKLGTVKDAEQRNVVNRVCFYSLFYGESINWKEALGVQGNQKRRSN